MTGDNRVIDILIDEMKSLKDMVAANHTSSETSRRKLHDDQNEFRIAIMQIDHKVEAGNRETTQIKERLENAEKVTSEMKMWRERLTGMKMVLVGQWVFVAFVIGGALTLGWRWIQAKLGL